MPPLRLASLLLAEFPDLSTTSRAILSALACRNGKGPPAEEIAAWVGFRDRHQLHRRLRREGLPPLKQLTGWARVLYWMLEADASGSSLLKLADRDHTHAASAYRLVRRVTGLSWSAARRAGLNSALSQFREECRPYTRITPGPDSGPAPSRYGRPTAKGDSELARLTPRVATQHPHGILAGRLRLDGYPFDVAIGRDGMAYVTRLHAAALACVSLEPLRLVESVITGAAPTMVVLSPSAERAYVNNQFSGDLAIIDLDRRALAGAVRISGDPLGEVLAPDGRTIYVVTNLDRLHAIDAQTARVKASAPVPSACQSLAMHPSGRWLYVPTWRGGETLEVDAQTLRTTRTFSSGGTTQDVVVSADGLMFYVTNLAGWLDAFHLLTGRHVARVNLGTAAVSLAVTPDEAVLYVGLLYAGQVLQLERTTLRVLRTLDTGGKPRRVAFDARGRSAVIANESGWVDLVH